MQINNKQTINLRIILVGTTHAGNIGSVARAMKTFALSDLVLVSPKVLPNEKSKALASNAKDILEQIKIVDTLENATKGCDRVIGTSTRLRRFNSICKPLRESMHSLTDTFHQIAIVFGRENSGLSNEELDCCDEQIYIPANHNYSSLNLAQAVQVVTYEWGLNQLRITTKSNKNQQNKLNDLASHTEFYGMLEHCEEMLLAVGFLDKNEPRLLMRRLKHLFNRTELNKKELNIMRGVFAAILKKVL